MTLQGVIHNGVVVLEPGIQVPEGSVVSVYVTTPASAAAKSDRMTEEEKQRLLAIVNRISSLPSENPGDTFSGADHDKVLYGEP